MFFTKSFCSTFGKTKVAIMDLTKFQGVFPPVPTILDQNGQLDKKGMAALIDKLIDEGANGMLFLGSGGEFCHMPYFRPDHISGYQRSNKQ